MGKRLGKPEEAWEIGESCGRLGEADEGWDHRVAGKVGGCLERLGEIREN